MKVTQVTLFITGHNDLLRKLAVIDYSKKIGAVQQADLTHLTGKKQENKEITGFLLLKKIGQPSPE